MASRATPGLRALCGTLGPPRGLEQLRAIPGVDSLQEPLGVQSLLALASQRLPTSTCPLLGLDGLHDLNGLGDADVHDDLDGADVHDDRDEVDVHNGLEFHDCLDDLDAVDVHDDLEVVDVHVGFDDLHVRLDLLRMPSRCAG